MALIAGPVFVVGVDAAQVGFHQRVAGQPARAYRLMHLGDGGLFHFKRRRRLGR